MLAPWALIAFYCVKKSALSSKRPAGVDVQEKYTYFISVYCYNVARLDIKIVVFLADINSNASIITVEGEAIIVITSIVIILFFIILLFTIYFYTYSIIAIIS